MPVSGLVVTLTPPPEIALEIAPEMSPPADISPDNPYTAKPLHDSSAHVIEQINQHPHLQTGPQQGNRLPVVVDTPDREADKLCWQWLNELQGVHHVDVAFIHFEDEDAFNHPPCQTHTHTDQLITAPTIGET